ncbi:hypothetical protein [Sphingomonas sp. R86520]|uniref:hypothetical protein n=1 Tax=Sphingomonas sp. R86520 TaxID=3093859 RepID=UPI0036D2209F
MLDKAKAESTATVAAAAKGATGRPRRTDPAILEAVVAEVQRMVDGGARGPASLLARRLAERGVKVAVSTLRAGDCRPHLERVWDRRLRSVRSFGPTDGHDMRPVDELVDHVIDLKCRIGRVEADLEGRPYDRNDDVERDVRSLAACRKHDDHKRDTAARIEALIPRMAAAGTVPTFDSVSEALGEAGHPLSARRIRSRDEYSRPILRFHGVEPPMKPFDPERDRLSRLSAEELGAMVRALLAELREKEARFEATLE